MAEELNKVLVVGEHTDLISLGGIGGGTLLIEETEEVVVAIIPTLPENC